MPSGQNSSSVHAVHVKPLLTPVQLPWRHWRSPHWALLHGSQVRPRTGLQSTGDHSFRPHTAHCRQATKLVSLANVPVPHGVHMAEPGWLAAVPIPQGMHEDLSELPGIGLAVPGAHAWHTEMLEPPRLELKVPAGQGSNVCLTLAAPLAAQKPPAGQSAHAVELSSSLSLPGGH